MGVNLFTLLWVALLMFDVFKFVMVVYCGCFNLVRLLFALGGVLWIVFLVVLLVMLWVCYW